MTEKMKILIAYDGSECADEAINGLKRAGLPDALEAVVISVADVFLPPPIHEGVDDTFPFYITPGIRRAHEHATREVDKARKLAERAAERIKTLFPHWEVRAEAYADSPAWAVIKKAFEWKADLVIVGSHGHSLFGGRLILGSVSQLVLYEAHCSVRVARGSVARDAGSPIRILIGTDGSADAEAAIEAVAARVWPKGTEVHVVAVLDSVTSLTHDPAEIPVATWVDSAEKLRAAGLVTNILVKEGDPKRVLVEEAEACGADAIFVGSKGVRGIDRLLLGSVSAAIAARAHCSVEVVRQRRHASE